VAILNVATLFWQIKRTLFPGLRVSEVTKRFFETRVSQVGGERRNAQEAGLIADRRGVKELFFVLDFL